MIERTPALALQSFPYFLCSFAAFEVEYLQYMEGRQTGPQTATQLLISVVSPVARNAHIVQTARISLSS